MATFWWHQFSRLCAAQYSFSLTTFSPSGKLVQIEYALNAVAQGATSLGIKAANGVVIATEKKLQSTLVEEDTVQKISLLTPNIGVAYSGMGPDSRVLVRKARKQAQVIQLLTLQLSGQVWQCLTINVLQAYYRVYKEHIPVAQLCREIAATMQEFTRAPLTLSNGAACPWRCNRCKLARRVWRRAALWRVPHAGRLRRERAAAIPD